MVRLRFFGDDALFRGVTTGDAEHAWNGVVRSSICLWFTQRVLPHFVPLKLHENFTILKSANEIAQFFLFSIREKI